MTPWAQGLPPSTALRPEKVKPLTQGPYLVLTQPMTAVQDDLVSGDPVLAGRVIVEAVAFQSFVPELSKT